LPQLSSTALCRASLALVLAGLGAAAAWGQVQVVPDDFDLRPTLGQQAKKSDSAKGERQPQAFGSPPGAGAGDTGFVSTNLPKSGAKQGSKTAKPAAADAKAAPAKSKLAERVGQAIDADETTGTVPRRPVRRAEEEEEPFAAVGIRVGSFDVKPSVEIHGGYDDNPFRLSAGARGSSFIKAEAKIETKSNWSRHELTGELRGAYTDFLQVPNNDRPEAEAKLRGRIDVTSQSRIELEGRAALTTDSAGTPDAVTSAKQPPHIYTAEGSARFVQRFNRLELGLRGSVERRMHQDADLLSGGTQDLSDRDYVSYGLSLRGGYESTPDIKPFVEAGVDLRVFDHKIDFGGIRRGSDGIRARAGVEFARERVLTGEISAGYAWRTYEDPTLRDVAGLIFDASLIWKATGLTTVTLKANSEIGETTLAGASGVFHRQASITIDHAFRRWLIGSVGVVYGIDDYDGAGRRDDRLELSAGLTYHLSRYAAIKAEFRREQLRSNAPDSDYNANIVMLGLRLQR
jgi:hypothetical protein